VGGGASRIAMIDVATISSAHLGIDKVKSGGLPDS